jgi:UDP-glucuronate decarboxylase
MAVSELSKLLQASTSPVQKILITGASGWIGRETIALIKPIFGDEFSHRVTLVGSRDATIVVNELTHQVRGLREIAPDEQFDLVIHLAFLTQDKVSRLGVEEFAHQNRELSSFVFNLCTRARTRYVLVASSGAADPVTLSGYKSEAKKLYGQLKQEEEELFQKLDRALVEICRIWTISGSQMQSPQKYALGDFILQAQEKGTIQMGSSGVVKRTYIDAGELMTVLLLNLLNGGSGIMDSGGFETSIQDLAQIVLNEIHPLGSVIISSTATDDDIYVPKATRFNEMAKELGIYLSPLQEQVQKTLKGQFFR